MPSPTGRMDGFEPELKHLLISAEAADLVLLANQPSLAHMDLAIIEDRAMAFYEEKLSRSERQSTMFASLYGYAATAIGLGMSAMEKPSGPMWIGGNKHALKPRRKKRNPTQEKRHSSQRAAKQARKKNRK